MRNRTKKPLPGLAKVRVRPNQNQITGFGQRRDDQRFSRCPCANPGGPSLLRHPTGPATPGMPWPAITTPRSTVLIVQPSPNRRARRSGKLSHEQRAQAEGGKSNHLFSPPAQLTKIDQPRQAGQNNHQPGGRLPEVQKTESSKAEDQICRPMDAFGPDRIVHRRQEYFDHGGIGPAQRSLRRRHPMRPTKLTLKVLGSRSVG